jgi:hypothetical protein
MRNGVRQKIDLMSLATHHVHKGITNQLKLVGASLDHQT